ncbi:hypothetical protein [Okeania sp. SIO1I7]|nr:hypothetical protein [Okeania sp. SIO1I7]
MEIIPIFVAVLTLLKIIFLVRRAIASIYHIFLAIFLPQPYKS